MLPPVFDRLKYRKSRQPGCNVLGLPSLKLKKYQWALCLAVLFSCSSKSGAEQSDRVKAQSPPPIKRATENHRENNSAVRMFRGATNRTGQSNQRGPRAAHPIWAFRTGGRIYADPTVAQDGTVYVASHDGFLYAVAPDGKEKWSFDAGGKIWATPAIGDDGTIYFGSDADKLFAVTPEGRLKWSLSTEMPPEKKGEKVPESTWDVDTSPLLGADGTIYFACHYYLYAVRPSGELRWRFQAGTGRVKIFSSPAMGDDGTLYFGTQGNRFFAVGGTGVARWNIVTEGDNDSTPAVNGDIVYFGSDDGKVRAANSATGELKWTADLKHPIRAPVSIGHDGTVYAAVYATEPFVVALSGDTGAELWRYKTDAGEGAFFGIQSGILVDKEGYLYFGSRDKFIYCLSPKGTLKWRYETGDQVDSGPVLGPDGTLYAGSDDKRLIAIK